MYYAFKSNTRKTATTTLKQIHVRYESYVEWIKDSEKNKIREFLDYMIGVRTVIRELIAERTPKKEILNAAGEVKYYYTLRDPTPEYYRRWKEQYLGNWYNHWKKA
jgi:glutaredoxin-related protein